MMSTVVLPARGMFKGLIQAVRARKVPFKKLTKVYDHNGLCTRKLKGLKKYSPESVRYLKVYNDMEAKVQAFEPCNRANLPADERDLQNKLHSKLLGAFELEEMTAKTKSSIVKLRALGHALKKNRGVFFVNHCPKRFIKQRVEFLSRLIEIVYTHYTLFQNNFKEETRFRSESCMSLLFSVFGALSNFDAPSFREQFTMPGDTQNDPELWKDYFHAHFMGCITRDAKIIRDDMDTAVRESYIQTLGHTFTLPTMLLDKFANGLHKDDREDIDKFIRSYTSPKAAKKVVKLLGA